MDFSGKSGNSSLSFRYNADREELEDIYDISEDDPPTPRNEVTPSTSVDNASPKLTEKGSSILDKYFKSMKADKTEDSKDSESNMVNESATSTPKKDVTSSPMKDYLHRLGKRSTHTDPTSENFKENEPWKLFHDFKNKISQAVEDIKSSRTNDDKSIARDNSISDSEENSAYKDSDQSIGDTDNQAPSLDSSIQNLSEISEAMTTKINAQGITHSEETPTPKDADKTFDSTMPDIDTGVEALEDYDLETNTESSNVSPKTHLKFSTVPLSFHKCDEEIYNNTKKHYFLTIPMIALTVFLIGVTVFLSLSHVFTGFTFGVWILSFLQRLSTFLLDMLGYNKDVQANIKECTKEESPLAANSIPPIKEHKPTYKYEGWINEYKRSSYSPFEYNVQRTTSAYMKIEGSSLRLSYTKSKIPKKALFDEKIEKVNFYKHCIYNLKGAKVLLEPNGIVRKRFWSKKYPICVILNDNEDYQVLERDPKHSEKVDKSHDKIEKSHDKLDKSQEKLTDKSLDKLEKVYDKSDNILPEESERLFKPIEHSPTPTKKLSFVWVKKDTGETTEFGRFKRRIKQKFLREKLIEATTSAKEWEIESKMDIPDEQYQSINQILHEAEKLQSPSTEDEYWSLKTVSTSNTKLYIFSRTGRDKYDWYRLLHAGSQTKTEQTPENETEGTVHTERNNDSVAFTSGSSGTCLQPEINFDQATDEDLNWRSYESDFLPYLYKYMKMYKTEEICSCESSLWWFNMLTARAFYDALRSKALHDYLQNKVQKKLATIKVPSFTGGLRVISLSLGDSAPAFQGVHSVERNARGVWIRLKVKYKSNARITLATSINLRKLNEANSSDETTDGNIVETDLVSQSLPRARKRAAVFHSDVEDSAESSTEEDSGDGCTTTTSEGGGGSSTKKIIKMVDKITTSKYFQQISDYKYVKKAVEGLSNTDIRVQLELRELEGILNVNLPDPPHDRLWIGFEPKPSVSLRATAILGARPLRFSQLTGWIEQKLIVELHRSLVMPNMEDFVINGLAPTQVLFE